MLTTSNPPEAPRSEDRGADADGAELSGLLARLSEGDWTALARFVEIMEDPMRQEAHFARVRAGAGETNRTTALVNEGILRIMKQTSPEWSDASHFRRSFALSVWHFLVSAAREHLAQKRGGGAHHTGLDSVPRGNAANDPAYENSLLEIVEIDRALAALEQADSAAHAVFVQRYLLGATIPEAAHALGLSATRVKEKWADAKLFLEGAMALGNRR